VRVCARVWRHVRRANRIEFIRLLPPSFPPPHPTPPPPSVRSSRVAGIRPPRHSSPVLCAFTFHPPVSRHAAVRFRQPLSTRRIKFTVCTAAHYSPSTARTCRRPVGGGWRPPKGIPRFVSRRPPLVSRGVRLDSGAGGLALSPFYSLPPLLLFCQPRRVAGDKSAPGQTFRDSWKYCLLRLIQHARK